VKAPEVRYARSGDVNIAYGVVGEGPFDIVFVSGSVFSSLEYAWEGPPADFFSRLASFSRLILFDKRGTGLSDRTVGIPDLETRMDDVRAVMDAAGSPRAAVMGVSEGGAMTILFAASYPERTAVAVLYGTMPSGLRNDDFPWDWSREEALEYLKDFEARWATPEYPVQRLQAYAPALTHDDGVRRWWTTLFRLSSSPRAAADLARMSLELDVRHVLPTIRVPTLVLHTVGDQVVDVRFGRYLAEHIPGAEYVELPGTDHIYWAESSEVVLDEVERFLTGIWKRGDWDMVETERVLATVLFTDIVGSTEKLAELGDRGWRELLQKHHALVRRQLVRFSGREIDTAGDGFFASFDGPARAIRCALSVTEAVRELGIEVRAGIHAGECEVVDGKVGGIAVHIGARVAANAAPGQVLVSSTVKDLVAGSGIAFRERGLTGLKGIPGEWHLYSVGPGTSTE
jgi:pimeloyl-ACP methyl ester carboxylesterase